MFLVGLTGGIATGKSTVSTMFKDLGVPVVDADIIARRVVLPGTKAWNKLRVAFGDDILLENGELDRDKLGKIIFNDAEKRKTLNMITHPDIHWEMFKETLNYFFQGYHFIVLDLPLLFEAKVALDYLEKIIVVSCEEDLQLSRLTSRSSLNEIDAKARIESQYSLEDKCKHAHFVINNSGSISDTRDQVDRIYKLLKTSNAHWYVRGKLFLLVAVVLGCIAGFSAAMLGYFSP